MPRSLVLVALATTAIAFAGEAAAFCRTTTQHAPVGFNPASQGGCWTQGVPLAWSGGQHVAYALASSASRQVSLADATRLAKVAFDAWNHANCGGGSPSVQAYDAPPVDATAVASDCGLNACDPSVHDPQHLIVFRDDAWPHNDPNNTLALTTVTYGVSSGTIYDADMEINSTLGPNRLALSTQEPPPAGTVDLQAILTHEAGHFLGLAHATDSNSVMFAFYQPGAVTLTADDVAGICAVYPPQAGGCSCSTASAAFDPWVVAGAVTLVAGGWGRRRKRCHAA